MFDDQAAGQETFAHEPRANVERGINLRRFGQKMSTMAGERVERWNVDVQDS